MLMIDPPPLSRISGIACLVPRNTPSRLNAVQVDRGLPAPIGQAHGRGRGVDSDAGVVDQDVQPTVAGLHLRHHVFPGRLVGDVVMDVAGLAAGGLDGGCNLAALGVLHVGDHHGRALSGQPFGAAAANAACAAADQRHLAFDPTRHGFELPDLRC
jgi:hypothetical protein